MPAPAARREINYQIPKLPNYQMQVMQVSSRCLS